MELFYKVRGQGPPLIILHGLFGSLDNWQTIAKKLAGNHTVYSLDLRNHGHSPRSLDMSYELIAEDLLEFMDGHRIYEAILMGHSLGGKGVMQFALNHPERVIKLIVVDMGPSSYEQGHTAIFDALRSVNPAKAKSRAEVEDHLAAQIDVASVVQFLIKGLYRKDGTFAWRYNLEALYRNYPQMIQSLPEGQFEGETIFIGGQRSQYLDHRQLKMANEMFPSHRLITIVGAGHWVHVEAPQEFLEALFMVLS